MEDQSWAICPVCHQKTRVKMRKDTILINFPLFCPKCKNETLIHYENGIMTQTIEPDALTQSH